MIGAIYPNPVKSMLSFIIAVPESGKVNARIIGQSGAVLLHKTMTLTTGSSLQQINLSSFANGTYRLQLLSEDGQVIESRQVLVMH